MFFASESLWAASFEMAHGKPGALAGDKIIMIAGTHDRSHCGGVDQAVLDEALIDVNANHLAESDEARSGLAVDIVEPDGPQPFAFQGTWRRLDAGWLDQQRGSRFQAHC